MQYDSKYFKATAERAAKTFVQTIVSLLAASSTGVVETGLMDALVVALGAALLSVGTSLVSGRFGAVGPSLADETIAPETVVVERVIEVSKPTAKKAPAKKSAAKKAPARKKPASGA